MTSTLLSRNRTVESAPNGRRLMRRAPKLVTLLVYLAFVFSISHGSLYLQNLISVAIVFAILAISLDLVAGLVGLYSLGHAGLFALGAYGTTLLSALPGVNVFVLLPVCCVGVGAVGLLLGALSLRVSGLYFAITTFIFTLVVVVLLTDLPFTGGLQGLAGPNMPSFPAALDPLGSPIVWCVGLALLVVVTVVWNLRASPLFPVLVGIRDAEPFIAAAGVRTSVMKVAVFGLSAAIAGLAGWAFSFLGFISPGQFGWTVSVNILVMVILGGINTRLGPIIGAVFVSAFPVVIVIDPFWQQVVFGAIFVAIVIFFPAGFMGIFARFASKKRASEIHLGEAVDVVPPSISPLDPLAPRHKPNRDTDGGRDGGDVLVCEGIVFGYNAGARALDRVDFSVRRGSIHGLIGPNGSGKSTLVNLISGQLASQHGTIAINGVRIDTLTASARAGLGLKRTFQSAVLVGELKASQNVSIGFFRGVQNVALRAPLWSLLGGARREAERINLQADAALAAVGLSARWADTRIADVPHGIAQLTQLAAACTGDPDVLILDEPLAGLSEAEMTRVASILLALKTAGVTIIVVEHQTRFIFEVCDEVTVLAAGVLVRTGAAADIRVDPEVRKVYLGE